jgi:hypothetical protein
MSHQRGDHRTRWLGVWQDSVGVDSQMRRGVYVDAGTAFIEHAIDRFCNLGSIHPMEGLCEADHPELTQARWQILAAHVQPSDVTKSGLDREAGGFSKHVSIRVNTDSVLELVREK